MRRCPTRGRCTAGTPLESESELLCALAAWPEAAALATEMRAQAEENGTVIVAAFADRLEGRAAIAAGDVARAAELLTRAADRFDELGAVWERALTDVDLAAALSRWTAPTTRERSGRALAQRSSSSAP